MRAEIVVTIEDDTSAEDLSAHGLTEEDLRELYEHAFQQLLNASTDTRVVSDLRVTITDNTKEEAPPK